MYEVSDKFYLRVPIKPVDFKFDDNNIIQYCKERFSENIAINSRSLLESMITGNGDNKKCSISLIKYLNRVSTRTTPYGLNAFVSKGEFTNCKNKINSFDKINYKKNLLLDYEWIVGFLKKVEKEIGKSLRVTMSNTVEINDDLVLNKWIDCFHDEKVYLQNHILIRKQKPFNILKQVIGNKFEIIDNLINCIHSEYSDIETGIIHQYILKLLENGFLVSDLRLSSLEERNIENLIKVLKKYEIELKKYIDVLNLIKLDFETYNTSTVGMGTEMYLNIIQKLNQIYTANNTISVDLIHDQTIYFDEKIKNDILDFINFLSLFCEEDYCLYDYYMKFIEKYNYNAVPMSIVFDEIKGIGMPKKQGIKLNYFNNYLYKINNNILDLSDVIVNNRKKNNQLLKTQFEIALNVFKNDKGFYYVTTPLLGSDMAYKSLGRFYKMRESIKPEIEDDYDNVELLYQPKKSRILNVLNCYSDSKYYLEYGTNTDIKDKTSLNIEDIYVCPINGKLRFINIKTGRIIHFTINNVTNLNFAPEFYKGIAIIEQSAKINIFSLFEQISETFKNSIICPKIMYKNFIIRPFEIRLRKDDFTCDNEIKFKSEVLYLLDKYNLHARVYFGSEDNYLLLDLSKSINMEILRKQLIMKGYVNIREAYFNEDNVLLHDVNDNNAYINESVFQIKYNSETKDKKLNKEVYEAYIENRDTDWLSIKLYMNEAFMDFFIVNHLDSIVNKIVDKNIINWFYIRYKDPKSHIRLRIQLKDKEDVLISKIKKCLGDFEKKGIINYYIIDEYIPEINRYGGLNLIYKIEELFIDSTIVSRKILNKTYKDLHARYKLYFIWTLNLIEIVSQYYDIGELMSIYKKYYRRNTDINNLRKYIIVNYTSNQKDKDFQWIQQISKTFNMKIQNILAELVNQDNFKDIILSIFHMNYNRVFAINRVKENELMSNIENVFYSLKSVLKKGEKV